MIRELCWMEPQAFRSNGTGWTSRSENGANYFELEASQITPIFGFKKELGIFGDEGYYATMMELKNNLIGWWGCIKVLTPNDDDTI